MNEQERKPVCCCGRQVCNNNKNYKDDDDDDDDLVSHLQAPNRFEAMLQAQRRAEVQA